MAAKYEIVVNGNITLKAAGMHWEYPQTDGEGSGATDENVMFREVLPERDVLAAEFKYLTEAEVRAVLQVRAMTDCSVNFYDLRAGGRVTKKMYPVSDRIKAAQLLSGEFVVEPFELRFIQMQPN
jgi:hypothetical protein